MVLGVTDWWAGCLHTLLAYACTSECCGDCLTDWVRIVGECGWYIGNDWAASGVMGDKGQEKMTLWWQFDDNLTIPGHSSRCEEQLQAQTPYATAAPLRISMPTRSRISGPALVPTSTFFFGSFLLGNLQETSKSVGLKNLKKHPSAFLANLPVSYMIAQHSHWQSDKFATSLITC